MKVNMRGGGILDRVVVNNWPEVYVKIYVEGGYVKGIVIMNDNDITQTKFISYNAYEQMPASSISNSFHMVIENVWTNMETSLKDVQMQYNTWLYINNVKYTSYCTWTSTVKPDNTRIELNCKVVEKTGSIITAKCYSETPWDKYVFNRLPIYIGISPVYVGSNRYINRILFGKESFSKEGSVKQPWDGYTRYKVTGNGTSLTINKQLTITGLPESFVSHWVNISTEALMGDYYAILVPPKSP